MYISALYENKSRMADPTPLVSNSSSSSSSSSSISKSGMERHEATPLMQDSGSSSSTGKEEEEEIVVSLLDDIKTDIMSFLNEYFIWFYPLQTPFVRRHNDEVNIYYALYLLLFKMNYTYKETCI
jgi:hypothetical protein